MGNWCLPKTQVSAFKDAITSGRIDPERLAEMSTAERRSLFEKELGKDNARPINTLFEGKLLLKNRQQGYISWAKKVLGENTPAGRDVISRIQRMDKILSAPDEKAFLEDLASKRLGVDISFDEAKKIADRSRRVSDTQTAMQSGGDRMDYGHAVVDLRNYASELKNEANKLRLSDLKQQPLKALGKAAELAAGTAKSIKASLDDSALLRQGWKTLWTNPVIWQKNARKSFVDLARQFGGKEVLNEVDADIVSRPTFDLMKRAKLDVGAIEEQFPTSLPEKIPLLGRAFKASEAAYMGFLRRTRADIFDKMIDIAKKTNVPLTDSELQSVGKMVNSLTGRGDLGRLEPAAGAINSVFFSPRFVKSHLDVLTQPLTGAGGSNFVRRQSAQNLVKMVAGTAAVLALARAADKDSVELDPRSANFGKIRIGDTRFDVTGGAASLFTLAARLASMSSKSSVTGEIKPLGGKEGQTSAKDVVYDFFENKLSPAASVVKDLLKGQDRQGKTPTLVGEARNLLEPLPVTNYLELKNDPNSAPILLGLMADALGVSVNTYPFKQSEDKRTAAEKLARTQRRRSMDKEDLRTEDEIAQDKHLADLRTEARNPDNKTKVQAELQQMLSKGEISKKHGEAILNVGSNQLLEDVKGGGLEDALNVYDVATPKERQDLISIIIRKRHLLNEMSGIDRAATENRLKKLGIPLTGQVPPREVPKKMFLQNVTPKVQPIVQSAP